MLVMTQAHAVTAFFTPNLARNGAPQWWLAVHGLTNSGFDAEALRDADRDGMATWKEWVADTDPTNPASLLRFTGVTIAPTGRLAGATWQGGTGAVQVLEWAPSPGGPWTPLDTNLPPTPVSNAFSYPSWTSGVIRLRARRSRAGN